MTIFNKIPISTSSLIFMPLEISYLGKSELVGLHLVSDALIVLAYCLILFALVDLGDNSFNWLFLLSAASIVFASSVHLLDIWTLWHSNYWISGYIKAIAALVSLATAIALLKLISRLVTVPATQKMTVLNQQLKQKIEELEQIQVTVREKEQFLQTLLNNVSDGIAACDRQGRITQFNPACKRLFGLPEASIPSEQWSQYYRLYYPDGKTPLRQEDIPLFRAFCGETVRNAEITTISESGNFHNLSVNGDPIVNAEGKNIGAVVVTHDISERKRVENKISQLNEELETRVKQRTAELELSNQTLKIENIERQRAEDSLRSSTATNRAILNAIPDSIFCLDRENILLSFQAANTESFHLIPQAEFLGKPPRSSLCARISITNYKFCRTGFYY